MPEKNFKDHLKRVNQFKLSENSDIIDLMNNLKETGFNAKRLALGCEIYKKMVDDKECVKFFGLAGALVPAGIVFLLAAIKFDKASVGFLIFGLLVVLILLQIFFIMLFKALKPMGMS